MANIKSSKKRIATNRKKAAQNRALKSEMQTALKKFYAAINKNDAETAEKLLPETISIVDALASKGIIHQNNASNKVAHLSKTLSDLKSGKVVVVVEPTKTRKSKKEAVEPAPAPVVVEEVKAPVKKTTAKAAKEEKPAKTEEKPAKAKTVKATTTEKPAKTTKPKAKKVEDEIE